MTSDVREGKENRAELEMQVATQKYTRVQKTRRGRNGKRQEEKQDRVKVKKRTGA